MSSQEETQRPPIRLGILPLTFSGDTLEKGEEEKIKAHIESELQSYFSKEVRGVQSLLSTEFEPFLQVVQETAQRPGSGDRSWFEVVCDPVTQIMKASHTFVRGVIESSMPTLQEGPHVLLEIECAVEGQKVALRARLQRGMAGVIVGSAFKDDVSLTDETRISKLQTHVQYRVGEEMAEETTQSAPQSELARSTNRVAGTIAYQLHTLFPHSVLPRDLPQQFDTVFLHIAGADQQYAITLQPEGESSVEKLGILDTEKILDADQDSAHYSAMLREALGPQVVERLMELWRTARAHKPPRGLRLRLHVADGNNDPVLASVRWEALRLDLDDTDARAAMCNDVVLSRCPVVPAGNDARPLRAKTIRMLAIVLDAEQVQATKAMQERLETYQPEEAIWPLYVKILEGTQTTPKEEVGHHLSAMDPHIIHMTLPSDEQTASECLERFLSTELLSGINALRLVILECCAANKFAKRIESIAEQLASDLGISVIVLHGANEIDYDRIRACSERFYQSLLQGLDIDVALMQARHALNGASPDAQPASIWTMPVLYMRQASLFGCPPQLRAASPEEHRQLPIRLAIVPIQFADNSLSASEQEALRTHIDTAFESYFLREVQGVQLLSSGRFDAFQAAKAAVENPEREDKMPPSWPLPFNPFATVITILEASGDHVVGVLRSSMPTLQVGPHVLLECKCIAEEGDHISLCARLHCGMAGLPPDAEIKQVESHLRSSYGDPLGEEVKRQAQFKDPSTTVRTIARRIAYQLRDLFPRTVFPNDLPQQYDTLLLHIGGRDEGFPISVWRKEEEEDRPPPLGHLDPGMLGKLQEQSKFIKSRDWKDFSKTLYDEDKKIFDGEQSGDWQVDHGLVCFGERLITWLDNAVVPDTDPQEHQSTSICDRIKEQWRSARDQDPPRGLRLRLQIDTPEMKSILWESLHLALDDVEPRVAIRGDFLISRYPTGEIDIQKLSDFSDDTVRVLMVIPDLHDLDLQSELKSMKKLENRLKNYKPLEEIWCIEFECLTNEFATWTAIRNRLSTAPQPHIIHLITHAEENKIKATRDNTDNGEISCDELNELLRPAVGTLRLLILQCCLAGAGSATDESIGERLAADLGVSVIAMQHEVDRDRVREFSERLYQCLLQGLDIDVATAQARHALAEAVTNLRDWTTPVLYMHQARLFGDPRTATPTGAE